MTKLEFYITMRSRIDNRFIEGQLDIYKNSLEKRNEIYNANVNAEETAEELSGLGIFANELYEYGVSEYLKLKYYLEMMVRGNCREKSIDREFTIEEFYGESQERLERIYRIFGGKGVIKIPSVTFFPRMEEVTTDIVKDLVSFEFSMELSKQNPSAESLNKNIADGLKSLDRLGLFFLSSSKVSLEAQLEFLVSDPDTDIDEALKAASSKSKGNTIFTVTTEESEPKFFN